MDLSLLIARLREAHPDAACALEHQSPFQLLVATILSAQCTDARVNKVTPGLFARYPDAAAMSRVSQEELEEIIRSTGFYRNKARAIRAASTRIEETFGGWVPWSMEELLTLAGVARKTANVVLGVAYGLSEGVVVDTHVERIARRLGLSSGKNPEEVERDLMRLLPHEEWIHFAHLLIFHGRRTCVARKPLCGDCPVVDLCPSGPYFLGGQIPPWERKGGAAKQKAAPARRKKAAVAAKKKGGAKKERPAKKRKPAKKKGPAKRKGHAPSKRFAKREEPAARRRKAR
jgi:endonuclease-3